MRRLLALMMGLWSAAAFAGGYAVMEHDASATGRGGTGTAALMGASSVHYNPANLSRVFSIDAVVGGTGIMPLASASDPSGAGPAESAQFGLRVPPHLYAAYGNGKYGFAAGLNAPFGGGLRWPDTFSGRFEIIEQNLQVMAGHVGGAYQVLPQLSAGATLTVYRATIGVEKRIDFVDSEGTALLQGSGLGVGASFGLSWAPTELVRVGLTARLPSQVSLSGNAHFQDVPESFGPMLQDQGISAVMPLPGRLAVGTALYLDSVRLFFDADYTMWSAFERFAVDFESSESLDVNQARDWRNAFSVHLGAEHDLTDVATLRGGLFFDQKSSPAETLSPSSPDSDRLGASIGVGKDLGPVRADLAYMFVLFIPRSTEGSEAFPARYDASAHLLALTLRFATPPGVASHSADTSTNRPLSP